MADHDGSLFAVVGLTALAVWPATPVIAAEYLSIDDAQRAIYPEADGFAPVVTTLTAFEREAIATRAGPQPPHGRLQIWRATHAGATIGYVFIDEVVGRSEFITYALGIDADGSLRNVEVLAYRESHGGEIRSTGWRRQFAHRRELDQLDFRTDIKNIAGATLSAEHVTQGVRYLVALWQAKLAQPASP
jgi:FMN-binding domain